MKFKKYTFFILVIVFFSACTKENITNVDVNDPNPGFSDIPEIKLLEVNQTTVQQYTDSLVFKIEYTDGNGDLGSTDADEGDIQLIDTRDPEILIFEYHLSPRAPIGSEIVITGTLDIVLNNTILLDENNESETTTFKLKIKDRAGNWSNEVETDVITITQ